MKPREKCGLFGVFGSEEVPLECYLGLHAQQHRGQESAGMIVGDPGGEFTHHRGEGLVRDVFTPEILGKMNGSMGIGHVRYSTSGQSCLQDAQPLVVTHRGQTFAIAHNGNITNAGKLKEELEGSGTVFSTTSDTEVILHKILRQDASDPVERVKRGLEDVRGAYSLLILFEEGLVAVRDPHGFRPLVLGKKCNRFYVASESCGFDVVDAERLRPIEAGKGVFFSSEGMETFELPGKSEPRPCSFETIYFSRPDSVHDEKSIHNYRMELGKELWDAHSVEADVVTNVPDSSNSAALGFARASGISFDFALIRSHYTGRTFLAPNQRERRLKVKQKFNIIPDVVKGKRIVIVDDSIVRGTTAQCISEMFRERGAEEIHFRIAAPRISHPCYYGIDIPDKNELVVNRIPGKELNMYLGADSVEFLPVSSLSSVVGESACRGCFTGDYPGMEEEKMNMIEHENRNNRDLDSREELAHAYL